jgi:hypothetical protein
MNNGENMNFDQQNTENITNTAANTSTGDCLLIDQHEQMNGAVGNPSTVNNIGESETNAVSCPVSSKRKKGLGKIRHTNQKNRLLGKMYDSLRKSPNSKILKCAVVTEKKLKQSCKHCKTDTPSYGYKCKLVSDEMRSKHMLQFWALPSWLTKKIYIRGLVTAKKPTKKITGCKTKKRELTRDCYMSIESGQRVRVCRSLFLATFDIGRDQFGRWTSEQQTNNRKRKVGQPSKEGADMNEQRRHFAETWIDSIPKVPSHYCRASTSKLYVESNFESQSGMHRVYTNYCNEHHQIPLSRPIFLQILESKNVAIHHPRKDQCDVCTGYQNGSVEQDAYECHLLMKDEARLAKNEAKESANDTKIVVTMDLQSILLCPKLQVSMAYYKRKLQVHNFTIYRLNDNHVQLYVWNETDGGVGANEFSSCVANYICKLSDTVKHIVLISDGCCGQNRNATLSSCLRDLSISRNIVIEQLYLEKGHTMMEADAVHSVLERKFRSHAIYAPSNYIYLMRQARLNQPYEVQQLNYSFFKNYEIISKILSIRPGKCYI